MAVAGVVLRDVVVVGVLDVVGQVVHILVWQLQGWCSETWLWWVCWTWWVRWCTFSYGSCRGGAQRRGCGGCVGRGGSGGAHSRMAVAGVVLRDVVVVGVLDVVGQVVHILVWQLQGWCSETWLWWVCWTWLVRWCTFSYGSCRGGAQRRGCGGCVGRGWSGGAHSRMAVAGVV